MGVSMKNRMVRNFVTIVVAAGLIIGTMYAAMTQNQARRNLMDNEWVGCELEYGV